MRHITNATALVPSLFWTASCFSQDDPVETQLTAAHDQFVASERDLREGVKAALERERDNAQKRGNLNDLKTLDAELKAFADNGTLPKSISTSRYESQLDRARARLIAALEDAVRKYTKDGKIELAETVDKQLAEFRSHGTLETDVPLFNGKDLSGWQGIPDFWAVRNGEIVGARGGGDRFNSCLTTTKSYTDFELSCMIKLVGNSANSGIHFRSSIDDPRLFKLIGPQCDAGALYWGSLYSTQTGMIAEANENLVRSVLNPNDYNELFLSVVGNHVTVKLNGSITVDRDVSGLPTTGPIGFELHYGKGEPAQLFIKTSSSSRWQNECRTNQEMHRSSGGLSTLHKL